MDVEALHKAAKARYWEHKDLPGARRLLEEGIALARSQGRPGLEKPLQYNLASFCWPGWDEPGIAITEDDLAAGGQAADENLRLARELEKGDKPMANAWFMVGAYHLAFRRFDKADDAFGEQLRAAAGAGDEDGVLLAAGYSVLAMELERGRADVRVAVDHLRAECVEHGEEFAKQLRTAARVFGAY